jgi:hypothetical protein
MKLDELTIGEARELVRMFGGSPIPNDSHWEIGATYFVRTVTHHLTGELVSVTPQELVVKNAAWIADDGVFSEAMKTGEFSEVEPYPDGNVIIGRGSLIDARKVAFAAPRSKR